MTIIAIRPKIYATESTRLNELFEQRKTLSTQINTVDKAILDEAVKTPGYAFIKGISGGGNIPSGVIETNCIAYELNAYNLDQRLVKQDKRQSPSYKPTAAEKIAQLGEKTVNSLLNGKALSAEEKRKLVAAMLPAGILSGETAPEQPQVDDEDDRPF
ncbi:hypothetical protein [Rhizobium rhizogenes]|uniref:hypothetical protein n=1 Tax=Rhizobium rhizogenes TaxID=359 RepID=UPI001572DF8A|nr:hypothetical protein [Rhizobium rhizogenes]NTG07113.1 hypothetical protein [Rhizobium rhizogenes]